MIILFHIYVNSNIQNEPAFTDIISLALYLSLSTVKFVMSYDIHNSQRN